ncbi:MAG TPA: hypothetical protein VGV37_23260 [Aliidongia sp.]|uniref:Dyp-type peroxidase n=1 Tax=Aliidongia sp. TaxID=1914230 RepID=UPI002DDD7177|nr:hypothetical protein [Aliidongia sp.]HEV2677468.1 hypothetical protein [Aliidongia sp.]
MAGDDLAAAAIDLDDVQGLLRSGYGSLKDAVFLMLRIADPAAARVWLATAPVTSAGLLRVRIDRALNIAVTAPGLRALGIEEAILAGFSAEFLAGMAGDEARSRRLGDIGPSAPEFWAWGVADRTPDLLVALYAEAGGLAAWRGAVLTPGFTAGFTILRELATADMQDHEPFGFLDGVSQPAIDWTRERTPGTDADLDYGNLIAPGEFLLGYANEYGHYTDRPLLEPARDPAGVLPPAADDPDRRDLGRNGSYLVFRQLDQDVRGFWRFAASQSPEDDGVVFAEAMVGRRRSGEPLLPLEEGPIRGVGHGDADGRNNLFTYACDPDGSRCPLGAHVRRANPRNGDMPGGRQTIFDQAIRLAGFGGGGPRADAVASSRFHRILRRGREYGQFLAASQAIADDAADPASGLNFLALNANISRQFEFIQNAWLASAKFDGLSGESDPLLGNRLPFPAEQATDGFTVPRPGGRVAGVPPFVQMRGGAYFFLPGLRALRFLAG